MAQMGSTIVRNTPYWLNFVYAGQMYTWDWKISVGAGVTVYYKLEVPAFPTYKLHHSIGRTIAIDVAGPVTVQIIEGPTGGATGGTAKAASNMDRRKTKIADTIYTYGVSAPTGGTVIGTMFVPSGGGPQASAVLSVGITERVLAPNTDYVVSIYNAGAQASTVHIDEIFYESGN